MYSSSSAIDTSIVVCTCSRVHLLRRAVESLLSQSWAEDHSIELIVVDDGSQDGTADYLEALRATMSLPVRTLSGTAEGIAAARNLGFTAARGEWIASFDDDQVASRDWLRRLRERADQTGAAAIGGALSLLLPSGGHAAQLGPRTRAVLGEHLPFHTPEPYTGRLHPATNNALLRRTIFLDAGGFDLHFTEGGEDKELFRRIQAAGHSLWFEPLATAEHIIPLHRLEEQNLHWTSLRMGASDARLCRRSGSAATMQWVAVRLLLGLVRDLPRLAFSPQTQRQDTFCSLWYTQGLLRGLRSLSPTGSHDTRFLEAMNFRQRNGERAALSHGSGSSAKA